LKISVTGPRNGFIDLMRQAYTTVAVKHYAKQLGINRLALNIQVRLHDSVLLKLAEASDSEGLCESLTSRNFIIDVATWGDWLTTLAHEMVHVKQFARGELEPSLTRWKKRVDDFDDYWDQPWEKEAIRLQHKLALNFSKEQV
jgi:hypothetical protein